LIEYLAAPRGSHASPIAIFQVAVWNPGGSNTVGGTGTACVPPCGTALAKNMVTPAGFAGVSRVELGGVIRVA